MTGETTGEKMTEKMTKKLKLPDIINIGPFPFELRPDAVACAAGNVNGSMMADSQVILLSPNNAKEAIQETLIHECLHAIWDKTYLGIKYPDTDNDSEGELLIRTLAPYLLGLLKDNPELVKFFCH